MRFTIETDVVAGRHVVRPQGELDLLTQGDFKRAVQDLLIDGHVDLVVDLDGVSFLDSTGLGALIGARRNAHALGGSLTIECAKEETLRLFRATSLDKVFTIRSPASEPSGEG